MAEKGVKNEEGDLGEWKRERRGRERRKKEEEERVKD